MTKNNDQRSKTNIVTAAVNSLTKTYKAIENGVTRGYFAIERGVTDGYKRMEKNITNGFELVCDLFIETFFSRDGESVEKTKQRLSSRNKSEH